MNEILFSSWGDQITDNRNPAQLSSGTDSQIALPEQFNQDATIKAFIGWDGLVLRSDDVNIVDLCRAYMVAVRDQSCGKCAPCQIGTKVMASTLDKICRGEGTLADVETLGDVAQVVSHSAKCGIGKTGPIALMHALAHFPEAFKGAVNGDAQAEAGEYRANVTAPCADACPIHLDIPRYVEFIKEGKFKESLDVIRCRLPIPGVVGRVCVRPCEENCRRANLDNAVSIKYLKRFVADHELAMHKGPAYEIQPSEKTGKVAIVGAGPAGVTCAFHLAQKGHAVTIFEGLGMAGDITNYGNRKEVSITRNESDVNKIVTLDLTDPGIATSEYLYIRPNDVIYVKPLRKKFWAMSEFPYGFLIAAISTGILVYTAIKP